MRFSLLQNLSVVVPFFVAMSTVVSFAGATTMNKNSMDVLTRMRSGETVPLAQSLPAFSVNGRLNGARLSTLREELRNGDESLRKKIVELLVHLGKNDDIPGMDKFKVIRNESVIRMLLVEGFAKRDLARVRAEQALLRYCTPEDLRKLQRVVLDSLQQNSHDYVLIAAKAKLLEARIAVENMASKAGNGEILGQNLRIAQAALGNAAVENEFLSSIPTSITNAPPAPPSDQYDVGSARDGKRTDKLLKVLGAIGTHRSLRTVCGFLRTDLKTYVPGVRERSLRYAAVDALHYNFPDEAVLADPYQLEDWRAIEEFCTARLGATFEGPAPGLPDEFLYIRRHR